jgi:hypothetical protein
VAAADPRPDATEEAHVIKHNGALGWALTPAMVVAVAAGTAWADSTAAAHTAVSAQALSTP